MFSSYKLLIVEDDPLLADLIRSDLRVIFPHGNVVVLEPAESFLDAVERLNLELPDIVLLDIELGRDKQAGIRLAHHINQTRPVPIVFLSGLERNLGFEMAKFSAPHGYLQKPYKPGELGDLLELLVIKMGQKSLAIDPPSIPAAADSRDLLPSIFVSTGYGELTAIPIKELVLLEADGKVIRAYLLEREQPIVFTSPGLKNFFQDNQNIMGKDFFQLSRKHVIRLSKIQQIKDNQIIIPKFSSSSKNGLFRIPIPVNGEKRKELFKILGR